MKYNGQTRYRTGSIIRINTPFWVDQRGREYRTPDDIGSAHLLNIIQWIRRKRQEAIDEDEYQLNQILFMKERTLIDHARMRGIWGPVMEGG